MELFEKSLAPGEVPSRKSAETHRRIRDCFPRELNFFGYGRIVLQSRPCAAADCADGPFFVGLQMQGDESGLCAVAFERLPANDEEESMWLELANVLASKLVTQLADATGVDIMVTPPAAAPSGTQKHRYLAVTLRNRAPGAFEARRYTYHAQGGTTLLVSLVLMPSTSGGST